MQRGEGDRPRRRLACSRRIRAVRKPRLIRQCAGARNARLRNHDVGRHRVAKVDRQCRVRQRAVSVPDGIRERIGTAADRMHITVKAVREESQCSVRARHRRTHCPRSRATRPIARSNANDRHAAIGALHIHNADVVPTPVSTLPVSAVVWPGVIASVSPRATGTSSTMLMTRLAGGLL